MGDRVAVMRKGELLQAPPQELYDRPDNLFVGGFIGSPAMNMIEASLERQDGTLAVSLGSQDRARRRDALRAPCAPLLRGQERDPRSAPRIWRTPSSSPTPRPTAGCRARSSCARRSGRRSWCTSAPTSNAITDETRELQKDAGRGRDTPRRESGRDHRGPLRARSRVREGELVEVAVDTRAPLFRPDTGLGIYDDSTKGAVHEEAPLAAADTAAHARPGRSRSGLRR